MAASQSQGPLERGYGACIGMRGVKTVGFVKTRLPFQAPYKKAQIDPCFWNTSVSQEAQECRHAYPKPQNSPRALYSMVFGTKSLIL